MGKPIDRLDFWAGRIASAQRTREHHSVYVTGDAHWSRIVSTHAGILGREVPPTARVLDAGCGYGRMAELFPPERYVGVDFSPDFIDAAKSAHPRHTFLRADLKDLPFADGEFDVAFCVSIKRMVQDNLGDEAWGAMSRELKRVARKVLILEYEDPEPFSYE
jgi:SAM-dependent methyltransferase